MTQAEIAQLYAVRNIIDAMLMSAGVEQPRPVCTHDETEISPEATLGNPIYRCVTCGATVEEP